MEKTPNIGDTLKNYWPIAMVMASIIAQWAVFGVKIQALEDRQDRQGTSIANLQTSVTEVQTQYAALGAKLDAIDSNVNYIRSRIDNATR